MNNRSTMLFATTKNITILLVLLCSVKLHSQSSFTTKFNSPYSETANTFVENSNGDYIGLVFIEDTDSFMYSHLYSLDAIGDTMFSRKFEKTDTLLFVGNLIQTNSNPAEYLAEGKGYNSVNPLTHVFTFFIKMDSEFNTIWEQIYQLRPINNLYQEAYAHLIQKKDSGYFYATSLITTGYLNKLILFDLSESGDSTAYRTYDGDSAGVLLMDLIYNYDSSAYLLFTDYAHGEHSMGSECITLDFDLEQISVFHYPRYFEDGLTGKLLPNGELLTGALYENIQDPYGKYSNMAVYKHDTNFNLLAECYVGDPDYDIRKDNGFRTIDYYYPNSIFLAGTFDYDVGIWIPHPSWIVIGKMDSDLNLLNEKYIGGDAYYHFSSLTATTDGGVLISANRYDYLTQDHEHDAYIIKLDSLDLIVSIPGKNDVNLTNAIVYPNPASSYLNVRTSVKNADFVLFDLAGNKLQVIPLTGLVTKIVLNNVYPGTYIWSIYQGSKLIETEKLIITN